MRWSCPGGAGDGVIAPKSGSRHFHRRSSSGGQFSVRTSTMNSQSCVVYSSSRKRKRHTDVRSRDTALTREGTLHTHSLSALTSVCVRHSHTVHTDHTQTHTQRSQDVTGTGCHQAVDRHPGSQQVDTRRRVTFETKHMSTMLSCIQRHTAQ